MQGLEGFKETQIDIEGTVVRAAVVSGLGNARKLINDIRDKKCVYDIVEVMACPGGCIDGGGQPFLRGDIEKLKKWMQAIHAEDRGKSIRLSYKNPSIKKIYEEYLGSPGGEKAHHLLHTHFTARG